MEKQPPELVSTERMVCLELMDEFRKEFILIFLKTLFCAYSLVHASSGRFSEITVTDAVVTCCDSVSSFSFMIDDKMMPRWGFGH